ncbi:membrane protein [Mycolicibacterium aurum]|uniref:Membrane protein n=2 Tax=Mycolicibacterium aurum TaxID=1791 RepID=A0A3S4RXG0_MYCAU|nr:membrane protein [Mycolicibacterium aurum]
MIINIALMLSVARRIMSYEMTLAEWIGAAILLGAPYGVVGVLLAVFTPDHMAQADGLQKAVAFVASVMFWPMLLFADVCMP